MTINYPTSLDNFTNPTSSSPINSPSHADQHANANDAIEALEAKVGITGSTVSTSHDYKIAQLESLVTSSVAGAKSIYQDVRNQSGSALSKATPVYVSGSEGASGKMLISAASNAAESTSSKTMGITTSAIADNSNGQVISEGILEGIDTTGAADGDPVWLGTNGAKIYGLANKPSAPSHLVFLGIVIRGGQANTGSMYVKIQNGFEIEELHNIEVASKVNGNILAYDSTAGTWKNTNTLQSTASTVPLIIKGSESQSVNIFEVQRSSGSVNFAVADLEIFGYRRMTLTTAGATAGALIIKGSASQTADLQNWTNSAGTALGAVTSSGRIWATSMTVAASGGVTSGSQFGVVISSASSIGAVIKGATSQTADLFQIQNSSSAFLLTVGATGNTWIRGGARVSGNYGGTQALLVQNDQDIIGVTIKANATQTANLQEWQDSTGTLLSKIESTGAANFVRVGIGGATPSTVPLFVTSPNASYIASIVRAASGQTANLTEWQNSAGTIVARVGNGGQIVSSGVGVFGAQSNASNAQLAVVANSTTYPTVVIKSIASQAANLQEWQNSSGSALAYINQYGDFRTYGSASIGNAAGLGQLSVQNYGTSTVVAVIRGAASQTADLQQWQNSDGTVLTKVDASGAIYLINPTANNNSNDTPSPAINFQGNIWNSAYGNQNIKGAIKVAAYTGNINPTISKMSFLLATDNGTPAEVASFTNTGAFSNIGGLDAYGTGVIFRLRNTTDATTAVISPSPKLELMGRAWNSSQGSTPTRAYLQVNANSNNSDPFINRLGFFVATGNNDGGWIYGADATEYMSVLGNGTVGINSTTPSGTLDIRSISASTIGTVIRGAASQSANLQEWQDSSGTVYAFINPYGQLSIGQNPIIYSNARISLNTVSSSVVGLVIRGVASQSANLQEWQNSSGTLVATVNSTGEVRSSLFGSVISGKALLYTAASATNEFRIDTNVSTNKGLVIRGGASQTANLQEWQNSAGTALTNIDSTGRIVSTIGLYTSAKISIGGASWSGGSGNLNVFSTSTSNTTTVIRSVSSQTSNLTEWQDSAGTLLSKVTASGVFGTNVIVNTAGTAPRITLNDSSSTVLITAATSSVTALTTKAAASQTANLQEWQDSLGTVLVKIAADGRTTFPGGYADIHSGGNLTVRGSDAWSNNASALIGTGYAGGIGLIVQASASQTADIQQWQISNGTTKLRVNKDGDLQIEPNGLIINGGGGPNLQFASGLVAAARSATQIPLTLKGYASQTSDLQQWQNSSGAILTSITSDGSLRGRNSSTISTNTATTIDTVELSLFTTLEYTISIKQGSKIRSSKVLVHTDGTSVDSTEYGIMEMGGGITGILVSASVSGTNSILEITVTDAATTNATVKLIKTML